MKAIFLTLASIVFSLSLSAQAAESQHLLFKGVPIDGTLNEYVAKMKLNGFVVVATEPGATMLQGDFASYKKCLIGVVTMQQKDLVSKIRVMFPEQEDWATLYGNYINLKEMLTQKYGAPAEVVEEFRGHPGVKDDGFKFIYLRNGECNYTTVFKTPSGDISLYLDHTESVRFVGLSYSDKINGEIIKAKAIDDL
jgi:hypothetical protein